ncbi:MAG: 3-phosphoshikimate 1-carboxyvinyltransferase [Sporomusaceae bacterium]|nr:3-phosphoshikimate 1-carboxyvinyltransferase [Sporomusaceae bacterium]
MEEYHVQKVKRLRGTIEVPGDKSVSHRAIMLASLSDTPVVVKNFLFSKDCLSTIDCFRSLGIVISYSEASGCVWVSGKGIHGLKEPENILDAGNSGTTMRLMSGILSGQDFFSVITGDDSLRQRPMARIIDPLKQMGAQLYSRNKNRKAPIAVLPAGKLQGQNFMNHIASAQIKSAQLLAGLFAEGPTSVTEPYISRNHTELMFENFGVDVNVTDTTVTITPPEKLTAPAEVIVPGDISSAAYWLVAATVAPDSEVTLKNVGINPTRTGIIDALTMMGANIEIQNRRYFGREEVGDLVVRSAELHGVTISHEMIPRLIDEIPVLAVAALFAKGMTRIEGASELKVKETDRLSGIAGELTKLGAKFVVTEDGLIINGPQTLSHSICHSRFDHRLAMATAIAGLLGQGAEIAEAECVEISYPTFFKHLEQISS